jgi:phage FluMu gp28-like protein
MSLAAAYRLVRIHGARERRPDSWVCSRDELQARLFVADCRTFANALELALGERGGAILDGDGRESAPSVKFANGSAINSISSNPNAQAGKRGGRVLDEFALHGDPQLLYSIALPGITWGGQLEIISTHRGSHNFFNKLVQEARHGKNAKRFSLHRVTLQDALEQGFLQKLKAKLPPDDARAEMDEAQYFDFIRHSCHDEATFRQEYMCTPMDDGDSLLGYDLIETCEMDEDEWCSTGPAGSGSSKNRCGHGPCHLGVDIGRTNDLSVFWLLELVGDVLVSRRIECLRAKSFTEQEKLFDSMMGTGRAVRACIDSSGLGRQFAERAEERYGKIRIEAVNFTARMKESLAYGLRAAFERRNLRIAPSDVLREDLHSIGRDSTHCGNVRLTADRSRNGHGDRFWALALAVRSSEQFGSRNFSNRSPAVQIIGRERMKFFL